MPSERRTLIFASYLSLGAVGMMVWSLFDATPIPVVAAMSLGQVLGTLSLLSFVWVVVRDVRARTAAAKLPSAPAESDHASRK
jgi:hypothetical protein